MNLGNLSANGDVQINSTDGGIKQQAGTSLTFDGPLTIDAGNSPVILDSANNDLGSSVVISDAGQVTLVNKDELNLTVTNASGPVNASAGGDINANVNTKDQLTLTTTNGGNVSLEGSVNKLVIDSDGSTSFGNTNIATDSEVNSVGDIIEKNPGAVQIGGKDTTRSENGKVDVRASIDGQSLNGELLPIANVENNTATEAGSAGGELAIEQVRDATMPDQLIMEVNTLIERPEETATITTLKSGRVLAEITGTSINVRFSDTSLIVSESPAMEARTMQVFMPGPEGSSVSFALKVGEQSGAYTVNIDNASSVGTDATAPAISIDLPDPLDLIIESDGEESAKLEIGVVDGALVVIATDATAQKVVREKGAAVVALALAELRKARDIKADSISRVMVVDRK